MRWISSIDLGCRLGQHWLISRHIQYCNSHSCIILHGVSEMMSENQVILHSQAGTSLEAMSKMAEYALHIFILLNSKLNHIDLCFTSVNMKLTSQ